jgi:TolB protein
MRKFLFLLVLLVAACSDDDGIFTAALQQFNHTPQIAELSLSPDRLYVGEGGGTALVTATFDFEDAGVDIESMHVEMSDGTSHTTEFPDGINVASGTMSEKFPVSTGIYGGTPVTVTIWLTDATGNDSNRISMDLQITMGAPEITLLEPDEVESGSAGFNLKVIGRGFLPGAAVVWAGDARPTTYVSDIELVASIPAADLVTPGTVTVQVGNAFLAGDFGPSNELPFVIVAATAAEPPPAPPSDREPTGFAIHITETTDGLMPDGPSVNGGMDWLGQYVVFASKASNLVDGDSNEVYDLFIRKTCFDASDDCTSATTRAVMAADGSEPNGDIGWTVTSPEDSLAVSYNSRFVAFVSSASNLVPDDTNGVDDVFLVDTCIEARTLCTPGVIRVSMGNDGSQTTAPASQPAVADDGRYVVFVSADPNLVAGDTNGEEDVFLRDTCRGIETGCTPSTKRASVTDDGGEANGASGEPAFTGRFVAFSSLAENIVAADSNELQDVFLRDTCIGELDCAPSSKLVSVGRLGGPADGASSDPQVSWGLADFYGHDQHGRFVAFVSSATNLVQGDTNDAMDVFERDLCAGEPNCMPSTARISVTNAGAQIMGNSWSPDFLRWDGESIPFVTAVDGIEPGDMNGVEDVFVRHHCPLGAPVYCVPTTKRISIGADGEPTDARSYGPRMSHDPFGAWAITYISEASNILPDTVEIPNHGRIYMDLAY